VRALDVTSSGCTTFSSRMSVTEPWTQEKQQRQAALAAASAAAAQQQLSASVQDASTHA
jgi:hypothetical protein